MTEPIPNILKRLAGLLNLQIAEKRDSLVSVSRWVLGHPLHTLIHADHSLKAEAPGGVGFLVTIADYSEEGTKISIAPFIYGDEERYIREFPQGSPSDPDPFVQLWVHESDPYSLNDFDATVRRDLVDAKYVERCHAAYLDFVSQTQLSADLKLIETRMNEALPQTSQGLDAAPFNTVKGNVTYTMRGTDHDGVPFVDLSMKISARQIGRLAQFLREAEVLDKQAETQKASLAKSMTAALAFAIDKYLPPSAGNLLDQHATESVFKTWLDGRMIYADYTPILFTDGDALETAIESVIQHMGAWLPTQLGDCTTATVNPCLLMHLRALTRNAAAQSAEQETMSHQQTPTSPRN